MASGADWALVLLLYPLALYLSCVAGLVAVGTLTCTVLGRVVPKDDLQSRLFEGRKATFGDVAMGLLVETLWQAVAFALQALRALSLLPLPRGPASGPPVLVVVGYLENAGTAWLLLRRLARAGYHTITVDYPSSQRSIARNAEWLGEQIERVRAQHGGKPIPVVAHSMGGLVARTLLLRRPDHGVAALYALCSPFRGTRMAEFARVLRARGSVRDMHPGSPYFETYSADLASPVPIRSQIGTLEDVVSPEWSAVVAGADNRVFDAPCGHITPLFDAEVFAAIDAWLRQHGAAP